MQIKKVKPDLLQQPYCCAVYLHQNHYYAGDTILGKVRLSCCEPLKLTHVELEVRCTEMYQAAVKGMAAQAGNGHAPVRKRCTLRITQLLQHFGPVGELLHPGQYDFLFAVQLPEGAPPSATLPFGAECSINYAITAVFHRPGMHSPIIEQEPFTVIANPQHASATTRSLGQTDGQPAFGLQLAAQTDARQYAVGDRVFVCLEEAANAGTLEWGPVQVELIRVFTLARMSGPMRIYKTQSLALFEGDPLGPRSRLVSRARGERPWVIELQPCVASKPCPTVRGGLIKVQYYVKVSAQPRSLLQHLTPSAMCSIVLPVQFYEPPSEQQHVLSWFDSATAPDVVVFEATHVEQCRSFRSPQNGPSQGPWGTKQCLTHTSTTVTQQSESSATSLHPNNAPAALSSVTVTLTEDSADTGPPPGPQESSPAIQSARKQCGRGSSLWEVPEERQQTRNPSAGGIQQLDAGKKFSVWATMSLQSSSGGTPSARVRSTITDDAVAGGLRGPAGAPVGRRGPQVDGVVAFPAKASNVGGKNAQLAAFSNAAQ